VGLDREAGGRPDSRLAAEAHAREWDAILQPIPPSRAPAVRMVLFLSLPAVAVIGVLVWFWSSAPDRWTVDASTPRGAVGAYIAALDGRDLPAAEDLLCERNEQRLVQSGFLDAMARFVRVHPMEPNPAVIWDEEQRGDGQYAVKASIGRYGDWFWVVPEEGQYRVCGFAPRD
jgi:hypothetical protein